jgi:hypothetical protein
LLSENFVTGSDFISCRSSTYEHGSSVMGPPLGLSLI